MSDEENKNFMKQVQDYQQRVKQRKDQLLSKGVKEAQLMESQSRNQNFESVRTDNSIAKRKRISKCEFYA